MYLHTLSQRDARPIELAATCTPRPRRLRFLSRLPPLRRGGKRGTGEACMKQCSWAERLPLRRRLCQALGQLQRPVDPGMRIFPRPVDDQLAVRPQLGDAVQPLHIGKEPRQIGTAIIMEADQRAARSEEHTSELQSLMRISYAVFCLKKKKKKTR